MKGLALIEVYKKKDTNYKKKNQQFNLIMPAPDLSVQGSAAPVKEKSGEYFEFPL